MPAINLLINENIISHEIRDNVIILKKKSNIVYEFPIPKDYYLVGTVDFEVAGNIKEKRFIITKNKLTPPPFIPEGFGNPHISTNGSWRVEENPNHKTKRKKTLDYINTSILNLDDFNYVYYGNVRANYLFENGFKIPKGFWVSSTYHNDYYGMRTIQDIPHYMNAFDDRARLIREDECMSLIALEFSFQLQQGKAQNLFNVCDRNSIVPSEYGIQVIGQIPDNWQLVSSSIENSNVYRFHWPSKFSLSHIPNYGNYAIDVPYDKSGTYILFPVIEENSQQKILKY